LGFLISDFILDQSEQIFAMILGTIFSAAIVYVVHFFKLTLDYSGVEHVQFEDDVYYYYVKAVPKVTVTTPQIKVKHINVKKTGQGLSRMGLHKQDADLDEDYDEDDETYEDNEKNYNNEKDYHTGNISDSRKGTEDDRNNEEYK
jgi:hypothetical protein